ncbi:MAG: hypothetical protein M3Q52_05400 [Pseudomonadota bacterium]|nr:hypothetical protein [Pseudomonadota bacterium]
MAAAPAMLAAQAVALQTGQKHLENGGMYWPVKFQADIEPDRPADHRLNCIQLIEFHPDQLIQHWALNKLGFATIGGEIKDLNLMVGLSGPPQLHGCVQANPNVFARP